MRLIITLFAATLILNFHTPDDINPVSTTADHERNLFCPDPPDLSEMVSTLSDGKSYVSATEEIDQAWYSKAMEHIEKDEYNITYSEELGAYQSPNRANNIRFIYHNDGFTAKTRTNRIPLIDLNDKTLKEEDKQYETAEEWMDSSPIRYAIYSGDVNHDGAVDATA